VGFQILALNIDQFSHLFGQDAVALARSGAQRVVADECPGYPCRVSLQDAEVGEHVLLMNYQHQRAASPYRASHAIYVRESASQARPGQNEAPELLRKRVLSVRAFDGAGMMVDADVVDGRNHEPLIERTFAKDSANYLHIHNAKAGCYAALVERA